MATASNTVSNTGNHQTPYEPSPDEAQRVKTDHRLGWHPRGGWCRKFPGDLNRTYFGKVTAAVAVRAAVREEERRERSDRAVAKRTNLVAFDAADQFATHLDMELDEKGEIGAAHRAHYGTELGHFITIVGRQRPMADLARRDAPATIFRPLRVAAAKRGVFALEKHVTMIRTFLRWCSSVQRLMPDPFYADEFSPPSTKEKRAKKKLMRKTKGVAYWQPSEVREIVAAAKSDVHRYAQVLLMLNGGMGASDLSNLEDPDVDWERHCIHTDRSKTLVPRVIPMWDITEAAMKASRAARPNPADEQFANRFFLTKGGRPLVVEQLADEKRMKLKRTDALKNWFYQLVNGSPRAKWKTPVVRLPHLKRHRGGVYTLRSCFTTLSMGHNQDRNLEAVILGQQFDRPIIEFYLRGDMREKLVAVVEHVRRQIWPEMETR